MISERYSRQALFQGIGNTGQERISAGRVAVIGLGALGSVSANLLARAGAGYIRLIDRDIVDRSNLQRQVIFTESDAREARPKAVAAADILRTVNSEIRIEPVVCEVDQRNIESLIADVDVVVDGSDNFEVRYIVNDAAVKLGKPWVYGGAIGASGMSLTVVPGVTACLHCFLGPMPASGSTDTCSTAGVLAMITSVVASIQTTETLKILTGAPVRTSVVMVDLWHNDYSTVELAPHQDCPVCARHEYPYLNAPERTMVRVLCGRDTVQIIPAVSRAMDLDRLAERLGARDNSRHNVVYRDQVLRIRTTGERELDMTVFPDGRALIRGARDEADARGIYSEYIGD